MIWGMRFEKLKSFLEEFDTEDGDMKTYYEVLWWVSASDFYVARRSADFSKTTKEMEKANSLSNCPFLTDSHITVFKWVVQKNCRQRVILSLTWLAQVKSSFDSYHRIRNDDLSQFKCCAIVLAERSNADHFYVFVAHINTLLSELKDIMPIHKLSSYIPQI